MRIRKDDTVQVMSGKERGKTGKILKVLLEKERALVEKVNLVKRHARPSKSNMKGGIIEKEASLHLSNLLLYCDKCARGVRTGIKQIENKKVRVCKKCGEMLDRV